ncbi:hypothetical protein [Aeromonas salmonicida]|uniref:hypothetical protein n=1 Tax=Aeromonas salmonicida TaxID=645 RepID=UPI0038D177A2
MRWDVKPRLPRTIVEQQGDYLLAVKGNQPTLFDAVRKALAPQLTQPLNQERAAIEQQHGRIEAREYHVLEAGVLASQFPDCQVCKPLCSSFLSH